MIQIKVTDTEDRTRTRTLDLRNAPDLSDAAQVFSQVGLIPWQPVLPAVIGQVTRGGAAAVSYTHLDVYKRQFQQ